MQKTMAGLPTVGAALVAALFGPTPRAPTRGARTIIARPEYIKQTPGAEFRPGANREFQFPE
jgi:hypothetical protein